MKARLGLIGLTVALSFSLGAWLLSRQAAHAHCDTLDGPVVRAAKIALAKGDVTPVLKWVKPEQEKETRQAFQQTLAVRKVSPQTKGFADRYFFETLVRLHRMGESAPYTGLKPAGTELEPAVGRADRALETGSAEDLIKWTSKSVSAGIRERFTQVMEKKKHADESVEAGRAYVEAYVEYIHYVERIHESATTSAHGHFSEGAVETGSEGHHPH